MASVIRRDGTASCSFDALCKGANGYVCDASNLVDLLNIGEVDNSTQINVAVQLITKELDSILKVVEAQRRGEVTNLYIGKAPIKKFKNESCCQRMNPTTWKKSDIGSHWCKHRSEGRHGLIVLTAVTRETTPNDTDQQEYALTLQ